MQLDLVEVQPCAVAELDVYVMTVRWTAWPAGRRIRAEGNSRQANLPIYRSIGAPEASQ
jgi:hypothetical protein